jgi:hypothetical protein
MAIEMSFFFFFKMHMEPRERPWWGKGGKR